MSEITFKVQTLQMNFDKESKSRKNIFEGGGLGGGGGGGGGGYEHKSRHILYTRHIVTISSTKPYSLMKIFLTVFKKGHCSFNNQGKITLKV